MLSDRPRSPIAYANEAISIYDVLRDEFSIDVPRGTKYKTWCPLSWEHTDGGKDRALRTYPETNSANCFDIHGRLTPVKLYALGKDLTYKQAAVELLRKAGLYDPRPWQERAKEIMQERSQTASTALGDPQELVEAVHAALRAHPGYPAAGVSAALSGALEPRLALLDTMRDRSPSVAEVREWFETTLVELRGALDREVS